MLLLFLLTHTFLKIWKHGLWKQSKRLKNSTEFSHATWKQRDISSEKTESQTGPRKSRKDKELIWSTKAFGRHADFYLDDHFALCCWQKYVQHCKWYTYLSRRRKKTCFWHYVSTLRQLKESLLSLWLDMLIREQHSCEQELKDSIIYFKKKNLRKSQQISLWYWAMGCSELLDLKRPRWQNGTVP